jgi:hypothetical protein
MNQNNHSDTTDVFVCILLLWRFAYAVSGTPLPFCEEVALLHTVI